MTAGDTAASTGQSGSTLREILNPGRMLADGIPYPDYTAALDEAPDLESWFAFWCRKGEEYERIADDALAAGHVVSAGEWLWQASLSFHYGQFMLFGDPSRRDEGQRRKVELYDRAAPLLVPAAERIDVPFEDTSIPGFLRLPPGEVAPPGWPCVLLIGGLESTKEEYYLFENMCLRRGLATFAFDGPGQGELYFQVKLRPDFERYASAVLDVLERRPELDGARLGAVGRSLGGFYAPRAAAQDERLKAVVGWGVFFDMSDFDAMPDGTQAGFAFVTGADSFEAGRRLCQEYLDLADVAERLRVPFYVLQGRHDRVFAPRQLDLVLAGFPNARLEVHLEPDGDHCCHNMASVVRPRMADWIAAQLGARP
jgi:2,6-dihydroxypseudooxynicotine hydrolase